MCFWFQFPDEDEETRLYRLKIEEQKRLREEILKQKELRRQQQAGARKKELLERLAQQQPVLRAALPDGSALITGLVHLHLTFTTSL